MKKKTIRTALTVLLAAAFLFSIAMMIRQQIQYRRIDADRDEAARIAGLPERSGADLSPAPAPQGVAPEQPEEALPEEVSALASIDLEALRAVNEDIVGWIAIPGTELSYPLAQGTDNAFYLNHNWKGEASSGGSVFLEHTSNPDFTDRHTIIYGHRMNNDSMFGTLKYYKDPDFWREHPRVYVVTAEYVYRYDIFAAQEAGIRDIVYRLDIEESGLEEEFLRYCIDGSAIDTGLVPTADDRVLTLSTCMEWGRATRWVVHGVRTQAYERSQ